MSDVEQTLFDCNHPRCEDMISMADGHELVLLKPTDEAQKEYRDKGLISLTSTVDQVLHDLYTLGEVTLHEPCALDLGLIGPEEEDDG